MLIITIIPNLEAKLKFINILFFDTFLFFNLKNDVYNHLNPMMLNFFTS